MAVWVYMSIDALWINQSAAWAMDLLLNVSLLKPAPPAADLRVLWFVLVKARALHGSFWHASQKQ